MTQLSLIPGGKRTVHAFGLDTLGHQVDLPGPASFSVDGSDVAKVVPRADLTNAADVVGVAAGSGVLTITAGGLTTTLPITVAADAPVSIDATVDDMVAADPSPAPAAA